jgi:uncharacterized RmlC-like cupin family protein
VSKGRVSTHDLRSGTGLRCGGARISKFTAEAADGFILAPPLLPHQEINVLDGDHT